MGRDLFVRGLVSSHSGNLSIGLGERIIITRRISQLGCLEENDLIETGINKNDRATPLAKNVQYRPHCSEWTHFEHTYKAI